MRVPPALLSRRRRPGRADCGGRLQDRRPRPGRRDLDALRQQVVLQTPTSLRSGGGGNNRRPRFALVAGTRLECACSLRLTPHDESGK